MREPKVHPFVAQFLTLYLDVRGTINDEPDEIERFANTDKPFKEICLRLRTSAQLLGEFEKHARRAFAAPVDPNFLTAWRDYQERYAVPIDAVYHCDFFKELDEIFASIEPHQLIMAGPSRIESPAEKRWRKADDNAVDMADSLRAAFSFAEVETEYEEAIGRLNALRLDWRGIFRRRDLVPFVYIPRHVAQRHGETEKLSLYILLEEAQQAFIVGLSFACIALLTSIVETVLREHYGADGTSLEELIGDQALKLPRKASAFRLHELRKLRNKVLHSSGDIQLPADIEQSVLAHLFVVTALIEGAPHPAVKSP